MNLRKHKCLLLNSDYTPLTIVDWQKALTWLFRAENNNFPIEILDFYADTNILSAGGKKFNIPAVAKTVKYFNVYNRSINFSRRNLFLRDNYTCQYCGNMFSINQLTYDHVIPKSRYKHSHKSTNWTNIVTSCIKCNHKKANRTPEEAGMELKTKPHVPKYSDKYLRWHQEAITIYHGESVSHWKPFLNLK